MRGEFLFHDYRVSVWGDAKVLEIGSVDSCTWQMSLMPLNCTLKNGLRGKKNNKDKQDIICILRELTNWLEKYKGVE